MTIASGMRIGRYEIQSHLGTGGMGEVYLARDTQLSRKVALKLLPENLIVDEQAKRRFVQEARAISALNHPHIITVYDITAVDDHVFITMEYVEGDTLRKLISRGRVDTKRAVDLTAQVAAGLASAHKEGIVHRDIKPDNLILMRASQIKILDFGLAKLVEKQMASLLSSELSTMAYPITGIKANTQVGSIAGTIAYMSPEQAEGRPIDHRTDIFSLGMVLYEMLTGQRPFERKSTIDTLHAIINDEPPPANEVNPSLPPELVEILAKALAKDPEERYQHAGDLELDLRRFKRALDAKSLPSTHHQLGTQQPSLWTVWRTTIIWASICALLGLSLAGVWLLRRPSVSTRRTVALENVSLVQLTSDPGFEGQPTFSPDGETIAYVSDRTGNFEIYFRQISGGPDINISNNPADDVSPAFSPDGKQIAFVSTRATATDSTTGQRRDNSFYECLPTATDEPLMGGDIWIMPALGGSARRIVESGNFPSWSSDGSAIFFTRGQWKKQKIFRVTASGGEPQEIPIKFKSGESAPFLLFPKQSADGRWITFESGEGIFLVGATGGEAKQIAWGSSPVWTTDSGAVIYSNFERGKNFSLWQVPVAAAESSFSQPLTIGRGRDTQASISRDGKRIAFATIDMTLNAESLVLDAETGRQSGNPQPITSGNNVAAFLDSSPNGQSVVFESQRSGGTHIWRVERGATSVQLTSDPNYDDFFPRWSPDGGTIGFTRSPVYQSQATSAVWLMKGDGADPRLLIENAELCAWMLDGRGLLYKSSADGQLYSYDLGTKTSRRLTNEQGVLPGVATDGNWIIYESIISGNVDLRAVPIGGGEPRFIVATPRQEYHPSFSPSGKWLYFQIDHKNIYRVPGPAQQWRQAAPEKITSFPESGLFLEDPHISRDGRQLVYSRGRLSGDIWIMKLDKQ